MFANIKLDKTRVFGDAIASKSENTAAKGLRQIDWTAFLDTLDARKRGIVLDHFLAKKASPALECQGIEQSSLYARDFNGIRAFDNTVKEIKLPPFNLDGKK
jgi:hypothetical protein